MAMMIQHLATSASSLPTDASTLDASISALKSCISALESSIKTFEGVSGFWEHVAWSCAFAVGVGIVGEVVVIVHDFLEDRMAWRRGIVRPPDHPTVWIFLFDIAATLLVLAGVFGEAGASMKLASINSQLRSKTLELRGKSDQLLSLVTQEAGSAASSAERANAAADAVDKKVQGVSERADRINALLGMMEFQLSARVIRDPDGLTKEFGQFKGHSVILRSYIAHNAGMLPTLDECGKAGLTPQLIIPLTVFGPDLNESVKIGGLIAKYGAGAASGYPAPSLIIFVGSKGPVVLGPTAQTRDVEKRAAAMKSSRKPAAHP
jgi:outer membrane murein-binding lipoprotein Lpp